LENSVEGKIAVPLLDLLEMSGNSLLFLKTREVYFKGHRGFK